MHFPFIFCNIVVFKHANGVSLVLSLNKYPEIVKFIEHVQEVINFLRFRAFFIEKQIFN